MNPISTKPQHVRTRPQTTATDSLVEPAETGTKPEPAISPVTVAAPSKYVTFEEWFSAGGEGPLTEWVDGEVIVHMSPTLKHQYVIGMLHLLIANFVYLKKLGRVILAPATMRAAPDGPGREPDVMFITAARLGIAAGRYVEGPPDLAVEVISDDSVARDRDVKYSEYEAAGIREYWIVDPRPNRRRADFFVLDDSGRYRPVPVDGTGVYRSTVIEGFWINLNWLWEDELDPIAALSQITGAEH